MTEAAIEIENLAIRYRRYLSKSITLKDAVLSMFKGSQFESFWSLRDVSLRVNKGERIGIIGRNGCGKTTLLRAMAGILPPASGKVKTRGTLVPLLAIGGGFQAQLTGRENALFSGAMLGVSPSEMLERLDAITEFAELGDFIDSPLATYSSGMRSRLGFAVATHIDPEILLLDEVFSVGDEIFKRKAKKKMESFFNTDRTIVMVSHSMPLIQEWCERCVYIKDGIVASDGPTETVIEHYNADNQAHVAASA